MNLRIRGILLSTCILPALWANGQAIRIKSAMLKTGAPTGGYHNGYSGFIDLRYQIENNTGDTLAFIPYYNNVIMEGYTMPLMLIQSQQKTLNKLSAITNTVWICRKKLQDTPIYRCYDEQYHGAGARYRETSLEHRPTVRY